MTYPHDHLDAFYPAASSTPFLSDAERLAWQANPRYQTDETFRSLFEHRLKLTLARDGVAPSPSGAQTPNVRVVFDPETGESTMQSTEGMSLTISGGMAAASQSLVEELAQQEAARVERNAVADLSKIRREQSEFFGAAKSSAVQDVSGGTLRVNLDPNARR